MKYLRIIFKYISRIVLAILGIILLYLIVAFLLSFISKKPESISCEKKETIYLLSNGVHLDIILERNQLKEDFWQELKIPTKVKYVAFGWGDKGFYLNTKTWNDLKASTLINALFLKSGTAMHVTNYYKEHDEFISISLCPAQLMALKTHIETSFQKNDQQKLTKVGKGYYWNDTFYEAKGSYNAIKTCNEWVNQGLKKANIQTSIWSPFDKGVLYQIEN
jgi:uncharacterized protein (TIGR02117 family)